MVKQKILLLMVILLAISLALTLSPQPVKAQSWLEGWQYRKSHVINPASGAGTNYQIRIKVHYGAGTDSGEEVYINSTYVVTFGSWNIGGYLYNYRLRIFVTENSGANLTDYQVKVTLNTAWLVSNGYATSSGNETRFTDSDGSTLLSFWRETDFNTQNTIYWVKIPSLTANSNKEIHAYFDPDLTNVPSASDGYSTFVAFDDTFDLSKWQMSSNYNGGTVSQDTATGKPAPSMKIVHSTSKQTLMRFKNLVISSSNSCVIDVDIYQGSSGRRLDSVVWYWNDTTGNGYWARLETGSSSTADKLYIFKTTNWAWSPIATGNAYTYMPAGWYHVTATIQGSTFKASFYKPDGSLMQTLQVTDSSYTTGELGLNGEWTTNAQTSWYDNYRVRKYVSSEPSVSVETKCRQDFGDIRITRSDGVTVIAGENNGWMESKVDGDYAIIWAKIPDDLSTNPVTIYVYYGNPTATFIGNGSETFLLFRDLIPDFITQFGTLPLTTYSNQNDPGDGFINSSSVDDVYVSPCMWFRSWGGKKHERTSSYIYFYGYQDAGNYGECGTDIRIRTSPAPTGWQGSMAYTATATLYKRHIIVLDFKTTSTPGLVFFSTWATGDDVPYGTVAASYTLNSASQIRQVFIYSGTIAHIRVSAGSGTSITLYGEYYAVAKYVSTEPSHGAWGNEETVPTGGVPNPPVLMGPANNSRFNPSVSVVFSWVFSHPNTSETQSAYQFQLDDDISFTSPNIDTGKVESSSQQTTQNLPSSYGRFYWRVRTWDSQDHAGDYSNPWCVIVDRLEVYGAWVSDERADVDSSQYVYWQLRYDFDDVIFDNNKGSVNVNGQTGTWDSENSRWYRSVSVSTVGSYTYTLTFVDNAYGLTGITGTTQLTIIFDRLEVYDSGVSDGRVNVGDYVIVWVKVRYAYDSVVLDSEKGSVSIGGVSGSWDSENSRWFVNETRSSVTSVDYATPSSVTDNLYGLTALSGSTVQSVVWDRVKVESSGVLDGRISVGSSDTVYFVLKYEFDNSLVTDGSVLVNGTSATYNGVSQRWELNVVQQTVGSFAYYVSSVSGNFYGITVINHMAGYPQVVWDRVKVVSGSVSDSRLDVGINATFQFELRYEFDDGFVVDGQVLINGSAAIYNSSLQRWTLTVSHATVGKFAYGVSSVSGNAYGITALNDAVGFLECIWDRILVYEAGVSKERCSVGSLQTVWFKAHYEYDSAIFNGSVGTLFVNGSALTWLESAGYWAKNYTYYEVCRHTFAVSSVADNLYGLTAINDAAGPKSIIWDKVIFTLSVVGDRINVMETAIVNVAMKYAYDNLDVNGYWRLNDSLTKNSVGMWGFTIQAFSDPQHGVTVFESNAVSIVWDGLIIDSCQVDLEAGKIIMRVRYAFDGQPAVNCKVSYAGAYAYTNASGWATFETVNIESVVYGTKPVAVQDVVYGLSYNVQNPAVYYEKEAIGSFKVESLNPITDAMWDPLNAKFSFRTSGTAIVTVGGYGEPLNVEVNRQLWTNWSYENGKVIIRNLASYVIISWSIQTKPEEEQPTTEPFTQTMGYLKVDSPNLGTLAPGTAKEFMITITFGSSSINITKVEFKLKAEWFTLLETFPKQASGGSTTIKAKVTVPDDVQGFYQVPFTVYASAGTIALTANGNVLFTVARAGEGWANMLMNTLTDPLFLIMFMLALLVIAASRRR